MSRIGLNSSAGFQTIHLDPYNKQQHRGEQGYDSLRRRAKKRIQLEFYKFKRSASFGKL